MNLINKTDKHSTFYPAIMRCMALVLSLLFFLGAGGQYVFADSPEVTASATLLLGFDSNTSDAERMAIVAQLNGEIADRLDAIHVLKVTLPPPENGENATWETGPLMQRLRMISQMYPSVTFAEVDGDVYGLGMPNDPDLSDSQKMYTPEILNLESAWEITTGSPDVVIAILDTGITKEHPEFQDKFLAGYDFYNDDEDPSDDHGHGTHVSGIAAAAVNNDEGMAGVCGGCSILPVKVLNENNAGVWSDVADGIIYAADQGAEVISLSLGSSSGSQTVKAAIEYAIDAGSMIVAAAGNSSSDAAFYPAAYEGVIAVAATDAQDERWSLSNYGGYIDVSAPGSSIYSTFYDLDNAYGGYAFMSGTSMAAPHVSGLIGLLLSQDPNRTPSKVKSILFDTAYDLGSASWDSYFGYGRIDPVAALTADAVDPRTARMSGIVWEDTNGNAQPDSNESERIADALIHVYRRGQTSPIATVRSHSNGSWSISQLPADTYVISLVADEQYQVTSSPEVVVQLGTAQHENDINFGLTSASSGGLAHKTYMPVMMMNTLAR